LSVESKRLLSSDIVNIQNFQIEVNPKFR
jgi:hypothetical protein